MTTSGCRHLPRLSILRKPYFGLPPLAAASKEASQLTQLIAAELVHLVVMTGSYFRSDKVAVLAPHVRMPVKLTR